MSRIMKRSAAFAATAVAAVSLSLAGAGTAGAAPTEWRYQNNKCLTGFADQVHTDLGLFHASEGLGGCGFLNSGDGIKGRGSDNNVIVLVNVPLAKGKAGMAWIEDPTGMYPIR